MSTVIYRDKLQQLPPDLLSLAAYQTLSQPFIPDSYRAFIDGGAGDETTLQQNISSFDRWQIVPRVLQTFANSHTRCELFGQTFSHPIFIAPVGYQRLVHPQGEIATAQAAHVMQANMLVSTQASCPLEEIAATTDNVWFQLYIQPTRKDTLNLIQRAEAVGYQALVVTIDSPVSGLRLRSQQAGFEMPDDVQAVNTLTCEPGEQRQLEQGQSIILNGMMADAPDWAEIEWLLQQTRLPVLLKGILHPEDARKAQAMGASGVIVSNHGGRTLDGIPPALTMLPAIRTAVGRQFPLLLDGGIRRGTDIFKALALGANAICIGRPIYYGLALAGALGVAHLLKLLRDELEITMALAGAQTLADISADRLIPTDLYILKR